MTKLQSIALYLIALLLVADFTLDYVRPAIALVMHERTYLDAARKCHESLSNWEQSQNIRRRVNKETAFALEQSAEIALMECYEKESLRQDLLAQGVSVHRLDRLALEARNESGAGLRYFIQEIASGT